LDLAGRVVGADDPVRNELCVRIRGELRQGHPVRAPECERLRDRQRQVGEVGVRSHEGETDAIRSHEAQTEQGL